MHKAMIFAAGLGTRLRPLTSEKPKALVDLAGKSLLQRAVDKLTCAGITYIVINIHHFPVLMREAIENLNNHGAELIISDESSCLLDTGGGLLKAAELLQGEEPFVVHNVDVISDINLADMLQWHEQSNALATLAVSQRETSRYFLFHNNRLCGWENIQTNARIICYQTDHTPERRAFSGIHIISPRIFEHINKTGVFSINKIYLGLAEEHPIMAFQHNPAFWADVGNLEKLQKAETLVKLHPTKFDLI
ncbi:MAG: NDP-sugar synthase [Bacteroidales bacterium]